MSDSKATLELILNRLTAIEAKVGVKSAGPSLVKKKPTEETNQKALDEKVCRKNIDDIRIKEIVPVIPPHCLLEEQVQSEKIAEHVMAGRHTVDSILKGEDDRLFVVCGPCSIHDVKAAKEYAALLKKASAEFEKDLFIIMRVYFEKPRTTIGWKGLINDPRLDGSYRINEGLRKARGLLLDLNEMGVRAGVEFLDTISPQFIADLVVWGAIGARTTESQVHRELASGISAPVGFKNGTSGNLKIAIDACESGRGAHSFLSVTKQGMAAIVHTKGNGACHVILRGGQNSAGDYESNFDEHSVKKVEDLMKTRGLTPAVVVDCSHANSCKKHTNQPICAESIAKQVAAGNETIKGVMIESNLVSGNQKLKPGKTEVSKLTYGQSVTDACIDFDVTLEILKKLAEGVRARRSLKSPAMKAPSSPRIKPQDAKMEYNRESLNSVYQWTDDIHIRKITPLLPPECMHREIPCTEEIARTVFEARTSISEILQGNDDRILVIVGPCSIHDTKAALEYAKLLKAERETYKEDLHIVMRVYFEKPRTTVGWKGLINDPDLDGSYKINKGLRLARSLLADLARMGVPAGVEFLDVMSPQYLAEFVSWGAIGARTTESQIHRELISAISAPVGFKNGTSGNTKVAIDACKAAQCPHSFLSITKQGLSAIVHTKGNDSTHVILRGGMNNKMYFQNYDAETVGKVASKMEAAGQRPNVMIDLSHANSCKDHKNQPSVCSAVSKQIANNQKGLMGVMIESHLKAGSQKLKPGKTDVSTLEYGLSVTDACMDFETTKGCLKELAEAVRARRAARKST
mmetsp:Transcript_6714/g.16432  ORF Transcript_6714/g.16432 Transcript_6714/m.16432 type:complete len:804 (+) Transcript_6714:311-2722(+)|eukprot:CAMPEP_0114510950 /NCGR_PEP_ID=MMETSP0109-20121206/14084_1 /TAXON_ID=29199 /ORGANISM="Chlorarachnion reptans, Strain CCCM449" /LENGTH=803 /DNA_ID=CAMNT_0001690339 /DNA_START=244 /DNA_END=2655 /DNA_ORIENTATION=+